MSRLNQSFRGLSCRENTALAESGSSSRMVFRGFWVGHCIIEQFRIIQENQREAVLGHLHRVLPWYS